MRSAIFDWRLNVLACALAMGGCAYQGPPAAPPAEPVGMQMARTESQLKGKPLRTLLDFEASTDLVFVSADGPALAADTNLGHTGRSSLAIAPGTAGISVKLSSLLPAGSLPSHWTLVGAYFFSNEPAKVIPMYQPASGLPLTARAVELVPGRWTAVLVDITALPQSADEPGLLRFSFNGSTAAPLWCDDLLLLDNTDTLVEEDQWSIRQRGFAVTLDHPQQFRVSLKTTEATDQGWMLEEVSTLRAKFASRGKEKSRTIYADGREYLDGQFRYLGPSGTDLAAAWQRQHASPGEVRIPEECGRVIRNAPGDANNDGYCEATGAYPVMATAPRLQLTVIPRSGPLLRPVLEIQGLPAGQTLVTMEGRLVESTARTPDGRLLVELPGTLDRPTPVDIAVR